MGEKEHPPYQPLRGLEKAVGEAGRREQRGRPWEGATLRRTRWVTSQGPQLSGQVQERDRKTLTWLAGWWDHRGLA